MKKASEAANKAILLKKIQPRTISPHRGGVRKPIKQLKSNPMRVSNESKRVVESMKLRNT